MDSIPTGYDAWENDFDDLVLGLFDSSSDEELIHGGSRPGKRPNISRGRSDSYGRLHAEYFADLPTFTEEIFTRRYRISKPIFLYVVDAVTAHDRYFEQRKDCTGRRGFHPIHKATVAMRMLAYGSGADQVGECQPMAETTAIETLVRFCNAVVAVFEPEYLRPPNVDETKLLLKRGEWLGFPGLLGSIDFCKWIWKNRPTAEHGQFQGKKGTPSITLEAIADDRLYIWHAFFGMPGCNNEINVVEASPLRNKIAAGTYPPPLQYKIAGESRTKPYRLADSIYPKYPLFVHTCLNPVTRKEKLLSQAQEGRRKYIERAFGVLQGKFHIISQPSRFWYSEQMQTIIKMCIILHNMMVKYNKPLEDEGDGSEGTIADEETVFVGQEGMECCYVPGSVNETAPPPGSIGALCQVNSFLNDKEEYMITKNLVIKHIWKRNGES